MRESLGRCALVLGAMLAALALARGAGAADLYLSGSLFTSSGSAEAEARTDFFDLDGSDSDSTPVWGGALGLGFGLREVNPEGWGARMPDWRVRVELEGLFGREYEFLSGSGLSTSFFSEVSVWSLAPNAVLEIPVSPAVARFFGRVPVLEPLALYGGGGFGAAFYDFDTTNNVTPASESGVNFLWHADAGIAYDFTESTTVIVGYRYLDLGEVEAELELAPDVPFGTKTLELTAHEFRAGIRFDFHSEPLDTLIPKRWPVPRPDWLPGWLGERD